MKDHAVSFKDVCTDTDSGDDVSAADSGITSLTSYSLIVDCPSSTSSSTSGGLSPDADYLVRKKKLLFLSLHKNPPPSGNVIPFVIEHAVRHMVISHAGFLYNIVGNIFLLLSG